MASELIGEGMKSLESARKAFANAAPDSGILSILDKAMGMAVSLFEQADRIEQDGKLIVRLKQEEPISTDMIEVMQRIQKGGFPIPPEHTLERQAWTKCCRRGFIGQGRDGYETLTKIGRLKLAEALSV